MSAENRIYYFPIYIPYYYFRFRVREIALWETGRLLVSEVRSDVLPDTTIKLYWDSNCSLYTTGANKTWLFSDKIGYAAIIIIVLELVCILSQPSCRLCGHNL